VIYNPTNLNPSDWGTGLEGWDNIPLATSGFGFTDPAAPEDDTDAFEGYNNTGFNQSAGIGDICRYISAKRWVEGSWRMPTYTELNMLYDETNVSFADAAGGNFANVTATLNATPANYTYGTFNPLSGLFTGLGVTASIPDDEENMAIPPDGTVFLPAAGYRYPESSVDAGDVVSVGAYGYYWSSTPYEISVTSDNVAFGKGLGIYFPDTDRSYAFPMRCIRDY